MKGYETIKDLTARVFLERGFVERLKEEGLDVILAEYKHNDLTDEQHATFEAMMNRSVPRGIVCLWWTAYDEARASGEVPAATKSDPWMP